LGRNWTFANTVALSTGILLLANDKGWSRVLSIGRGLQLLRTRNVEFGHGGMATLRFLVQSSNRSELFAGRLPHQKMDARDHNASRKKAYRSGR
jgi:hypothetical protein